MRAARRIQSSIRHVTGPAVHDEAQIPFGGVKASGYGRFRGRAGIEFFTELRWITVETQPGQFPIGKGWRPASSRTCGVADAMGLRLRGRYDPGPKHGRGKFSAPCRIGWGRDASRPLSPDRLAGLRRFAKDDETC